MNHHPRFADTLGPDHHTEKRLSNVDPNPQPWLFRHEDLLNSFKNAKKVDQKVLMNRLNYLHFTNKHILVHLLNKEYQEGLLMKAYIHYQEGDDREALTVYKQSLNLCWKQPDLQDDILDTISRLALKTGDFTDSQLHAQLRIELVGENNTSRLIIALSSFFLEDDRSFEEMGFLRRTGGTMHCKWHTAYRVPCPWHRILPLPDTARNQHGSSSVQASPFS